MHGKSRHLTNGYGVANTHLYEQIFHLILVRRLLMTWNTLELLNLKRLSKVITKLAKWSPRIYNVIIVLHVKTRACWTLQTARGTLRRVVNALYHKDRQDTSKLCCALNWNRRKNPNSKERSIIRFIKQLSHYIWSSNQFLFIETN